MATIQYSGHEKLKLMTIEGFTIVAVSAKPFPNKCKQKPMVRYLCLLFYTNVYLWQINFKDFIGVFIVVHFPFDAQVPNGDTYSSKGPFETALKGGRASRKEETPSFCLSLQGVAQLPVPLLSSEEEEECENGGREWKTEHWGRIFCQAESTSCLLVGL